MSSEFFNVIRKSFSYQKMYKIDFWYWYNVVFFFKFVYLGISQKELFSIISLSFIWPRQSYFWEAQHRIVSKLKTCDFGESLVQTEIGYLWKKENKFHSRLSDYSKNLFDEHFSANGFRKKRALCLRIQLIYVFIYFKKDIVTIGKKKKNFNTPYVIFLNRNVVNLNSVSSEKLLKLLLQV